MYISCPTPISFNAYFNFLFILGPMDPICTFVLVSNKTTNSLILDFKKVQTPGAARYMAEIYGPNFKNTTYFSKGNNFIQHITDLTPGTSYKLEIYALSLQNIKSANGCLVEEYTCK